MTNNNFINWSIEIEDDIRNCFHGCVVQFRKKNGTIRNLNCTLNKALIPSDKSPKNNDRSYYNHDRVFRVFDLDKNDWRSINKDTVITYSIND